MADTANAAGTADTTGAAAWHAVAPCAGAGGGGPSGGAGPAAALWLGVIGPFTVCRAGTVQDSTGVGSRKGRTLLARLAVQQGGLVPVDRLVAALWPDGPPRRPAQNVATLVSRLRGALGPATVLGGRAGYRLGGAVLVDLSRAAELVRRAETRMDHHQPAAALAAARPALDILRSGGVLDDEPDADWAEPARAGHLVLLRRARHAAAEAALLLGATWTARGTAEDAVAADPCDEAAHRTLMLAYTRTGEPARALSAYHRLRLALATELGVDPSAQTSDLYQAVLTGTAPDRLHHHRPRPVDRRVLVGQLP